MTALRGVCEGGLLCRFIHTMVSNCHDSYPSVHFCNRCSVLIWLTLWYNTVRLKDSSILPADRVCLLPRCLAGS